MNTKKTNVQEKNFMKFAGENFKKAVKEVFGSVYVMSQACNEYSPMTLNRYSRGIHVDIFEMYRMLCSYFPKEYADEFIEKLFKSLSEFEKNRKGYQCEDEN